MRSWWDRRANKEQARAERANAELGGDDWAEQLDERTDGPEWAWAIPSMPIIGWIGDTAILIRGWRARRRRRH